ncbi:MAG: hypothetical protein ABSA53_27955 [Streptosporangiaceae bacterium]
MRVAYGARRTLPADPLSAAELADPKYVDPLLIHIAEQPPGQQPRQGGDHGTVSPVQLRART